MKMPLTTNHPNQNQEPNINNAEPALRASFRTGPTLSDWLHLAMLLNSFTDTSAGHDLPFDEVYEAISSDDPRPPIRPMSEEERIHRLLLSDAPRIWRPLARF